MKTERQQYVFGPVPSRRLGRSLGVDLVPFKTCTYDIDKVQLNTAVRPPAEEYAMAVSSERLAALARLFAPRAEVIAEHRNHRLRTALPPSGQAVLTLLRRRPCTVEDVAQGLQLKPAEVVKILADLETQGQVRDIRREGRVFYRAMVPPTSTRTRDGRRTPRPDSCRPISA